MGEQSHAQMQSEHYQALKNPQYRLDGMIDVLREEIMLNMPTSYTQKTEPIQIEPREFSSKEWAELNQIKGRLIHLEGKVMFLLEEMRALQWRKPHYYK